MPERTDDIVLEVRDLRTQFETDEGTVPAVDGASWLLERGRTLALVGESGCGKSVTALSILRLIPEPPGRIAGGEVLFRDPSTGDVVDLVTASEKRMRSIRGNRIAMVFQEPLNALNPVLTIGEQVAEAVTLHRGLRGRAARAAAVDMLRRVGLADAKSRVGDYPHQLSGGMRQRVMLAMALSCDPAVLIADEPTTALDVTVGAQILDLLAGIQADSGMSIVFITHDLGVVARIADRVCVMYAGRIVEQASAAELFADPLHPYTQGLLRSVPRVDRRYQRLAVIPGQVPDPKRFPPGCRFHPRCELSRRRAEGGGRRTRTVLRDGERVSILARCLEAGSGEAGGEPALREVRAGRTSACWEVDGYDTDGAPAKRT